MSRQLLIETRMNSLSLVEGIKSKNPNCLGTIRGICADWNEPTRNGNYYSRKLWENVFKDPLVKEALEDRLLIGELDHPSDGRLEPSIANACITMTNYEFDDQNNVLIGEFDILPTPSGKILRALLDYGARVGVSSRGEGSTEEINGQNNVLDDGSYYFVGFDAVAMPAVKRARPELQESINKKRVTFKESLSEQIKSTSTKFELDLINKIVEAIEMPEVDSIRESINNRYKELEGVNNSSNTLIEDLERSSTRISELEESVKKLTDEVTLSKSQTAKFLESYSTTVDEMDQLKLKYEDLQKEYSNKVFSYGNLNKKFESLSQDLRRKQDEVSQLKKDIRINRSDKLDYEEKINNLEESLVRSQNSNHEKSKKVSELTNQLSVMKTRLENLQQMSGEKESKLVESTRTIRKELDKAVKSNKTILETYAVKRSNSVGINPKKIVESIEPGMTTSDIDKLINEEVSYRDRYRKIPKSDQILETLSQGTINIKNKNSDQVSGEIAQASSFMEQYNNSMRMNQ